MRQAVAVMYIGGAPNQKLGGSSALTVPDLLEAG